MLKREEDHAALYCHKIILEVTSVASVIYVQS